SVATSGSRAPIKLNGALTPGGDVLNFLLAGERVIYLADQEQDDLLELFSVPIGGGTPLRLHPPLATSISNYRVSPDGASVVFVADGEGFGRFDLFGATADASRASVQLATGVDWSQPFQFSPDSRRIVYVRDGSLASVLVAGGASALLHDSANGVADD